MSQRGSVGVYLLFSIAAAIASGYGVYAWMHGHKPHAAPVVEAAPPPKPAPRPVSAPTPVAQPAPVEVPSLAEQRAVDPPSTGTSPAMGVPGIDGPIERGSVDRRMRAKSRALQMCWDGERPTTVHVTLLVDGNGRVTSTRISPALSMATSKCIANVFATISFSAFGQPSEIVQPIAFR